MAFVDAHREDLGIEPICRELAIAPPPGTNMPPAGPIPASVRAVPGAMTNCASRSGVPMRPALAFMDRARSGTSCGVRASLSPSARWNG